MNICLILQFFLCLNLSCICTLKTDVESLGSLICSSQLALLSNSLLFGFHHYFLFSSKQYIEEVTEPSLLELQRLRCLSTLRLWFEHRTGKEEDVILCIHPQARDCGQQFRRGRTSLKAHCGAMTAGCRHNDALPCTSRTGYLWYWTISFYDLVSSPQITSRNRQRDNQRSQVQVC